MRENIVRPFGIGTLNCGQAALFRYLTVKACLQGMREQYISAGKDFDEQYDRSLKRLLDDFRDKFDPAFQKYNITDSGSTKRA